MALNVISNFAANVAHRNLSRSDMEMSQSLAKLSAGARVVSARDDAASMAIGARLAAEVRALSQAMVNSGQGVSMLQVAEGAMARANDVLNRMKTLAVQAGSGQLSGDERAMLDAEYQQLVSEIDRLALDTEFNGNQLVNGKLIIGESGGSYEVADGMSDIIFRGAHQGTQATIQFQSAASPALPGFTVTTTEGNFTGSVAANVMNSNTSMAMGTAVTLSNTALTNKIDLVLTSTWDVDGVFGAESLSMSSSTTQSFIYKIGTGSSATADEITVSINGISATNLNLNNTNVTNKADADTASSRITIAVDTLNTARANVGAATNRLDFASANIASTLENMEAARSNLLDLDVAAEMSKFTSKQILVQAGVAMLAQANQTPQNLLRLFQ